MLVRNLCLSILFLMGAVLTGVQACDETVSYAVPDQSQPVVVNDMNVEPGVMTSYDASSQEVAPANTGFNELITEYQNQPAPAATDRLDNADRATIGKPAVQYRVDRDMQHGY